MKKIIIIACALTCAAAVMAQTPDVSIKKGKATLEEAYYYQLKQKADAYEALVKESNATQNKLDQAQAELKRKNQPIKLMSFNDSASYAIGRDMGNAWTQQNLGINLKAAGQSLIDMAEGRNTWGQEVMQPLLQRFQSEFEQRQRQQEQDMMASLDKNKAEGEAFLKENAKKQGVVTTKSGLQYKIVKRGNGKKPTANSMVKVHYTGTLIDGKKFDSSVDRGVPAEFPLGNVIPGWIEGLQLMDEGSQYILYIPAKLAYGDRIAGDIPPGSTLIFDVQLLEIMK